MKGHRKSVAQEILNEPASPRVKPKVEDADLLLVNPTYAVALFYRPAKRRYRASCSRAKTIRPKH